MNTCVKSTSGPSKFTGDSPLPRGVAAQFKWRVSLGHPGEICQSQAAYRARGKAKPEYSLPLKLPKNYERDDTAVAHFRGGSQYEITGSLKNRRSAKG
eukprot:1892476-Pyramimonas_sp.AAC.1